MLAQETSIPVYFSKYDTELDEIIDDISKIKSDEADDAADVKAAGKRDSALSEVINTISANGYQVGFHTDVYFLQISKPFSIPFSKVHVSGTHHSPNKQSKIPIVQGELYPMLQAKQPAGESATSKLPTIIITTHIDNFGLIDVRIAFYFQTNRQ